LTLTNMKMEGNYTGLYWTFKDLKKEPRLHELRKGMHQLIRIFIGSEFVVPQRKYMKDSLTRYYIVYVGIPRGTT